MAALASLIPELENALQHGSAARHAETLRRIGDLFLENPGRYNEDHLDLFDDVLGRLVLEVETKALAELADRIAPVENAPIMIIRRLARDEDIAVAGPVLLRSPRLDETDLVDIARTRSQAHLLAISSRTEVGPAVTDVLVGRGDRDVVRNVATNSGARFSEAGLAVLVRRAGQDGELAERVGQRTDVPPPLFRKLLLAATEIVRKRLLASARAETRDEIKRILAKVSAEIGAKAPPTRDCAPAQHIVLALRPDGQLGEAELARFAAAGRFEETVATMSALCAVPIDVVERLLDDDRADPVLILCKAVGFEWSTERPSTTTAQRVVRFWQARQRGVGEAD